MPSREDIYRLRELGKRLMEIAGLPVQRHNRSLWTALNDLKMIRPVVHSRDYPLYMLEYEDELTAVIDYKTEPFLNQIETSILLKLYEWKHLRLDRVIETHIDCPACYTDSGFFTGIEPQAARSEKERYEKAVDYEPQIVTEDDLDKIVTPSVYFDKEATDKRFSLLSEIFDGVMPVRLFGRCNFSLALMDKIMTWTGIDEGLTMLHTNPGLIHMAAERYVDAIISQIRQYEDLGLLSSNNGPQNIGSNGYGYTAGLPSPPDGGIGAAIGDIWGESRDQIFTSVSPAMTLEFALKHEMKWAELFPIYSYGCCERLDQKLDYITTCFPNLRKISCSPYSNLEVMMERLGKDYVICFKPNSNYLAGPKPEMDLLRQEILNACKLVKKYGANLEINMKTMINLGGEPQRLWEWCEMASETVKAYFN